MEVTRLHALSVSKLPLHHQDPFDRMLIAQAGMERMTADRLFAQYAEALWCGR